MAFKTQKEFTHCAVCHENLCQLADKTFTLKVQ